MNAPADNPKKVTSAKPISLGWVAASLIVVIASTWMLSWLVPRAAHFGGAHPIPLSANFRLMTWALLGAGACTLVAYMCSRTERKLGTRCMLLLAGPLWLCLGAVLVSVAPRSASVVTRDQVHAQPPKGERIFAVPFFFANGSDTLSAAETSRLMDVISVFRSCSPDNVFVRGFASSARYRVDSDANNRALANRRAYNIRESIQRFGTTVINVQWLQVEDMLQARRLRDYDAEFDRLLPEVEKLNRRAELFWSESTCARQELTNPLSVESVAGSDDRETSQFRLEERTSTPFSPAEDPL